MPTDYKLYTAVLPEASRGQADQRAQRNVSLQGLLGRDSGVVESVSSDPGERILRGHLAGEYADIMATEVRDLGIADGFTEVPLVGEQQETPLDGYYTIESADANQPSSRSQRFWRYQATLKQAGTRASHFRAVRVQPREVTHPFGSDSTARIAIPDDAQNVLWVNETTGEASAASPTSDPITAELEQLRRYLLGNSPYPEDQTQLAYDVPLDKIGPVDVRVWDDRDGPKVYRGVGAATVDDATVGDATVNGDTEAVRWQRVFATEHDYSGIPVVENDRLRLEWDEGYALRAYRWDATDQTYSRVALGSTDWRLLDVNIRRIGVERI